MTGISACLIVRGESGGLAACLESIRAWVDEICVLDVGAAAEALDAARSFDATIATATWTDDFSAARNASLALATQPWILVIDPDERLGPMSGASLRIAVAAEGASAWLVDRESTDDRGALERRQEPRLFRRGLGIRYERRVHESILPSLRALGVERLEKSGARILHDGGRPDSPAERRRREESVRLLRSVLADEPDDLPALYALASNLIGDDQRAERLMLLRRAELLTRRSPAPDLSTHPFLPLVFDALAETLAALGRFSEAFDAIDNGLRRCPDTPALLCRRGSLLRRVGRASDAERVLRVALDAAARGAPDATRHESFAWLELAHVARLEGDREKAHEAIHRARRRGLDPLAIRRLEVDLLLDADLFGEDALRATHAFLGGEALASEAWMVGARVAGARGDHDTARALWENASAHGGEIGVEARLRLAVARLAEGDLGAAAQGLEGVLPSDVTIAAGRVLLSVIAGRAPDVDPAFDTGALTASLVAWLDSLLGATNDTGARAFEENATLIADALPDVAAVFAPVQ